LRQRRQVREQLQHCLPSATDMLESLALPAGTQARASGDYARPEGNEQPWGNVYASRAVQFYPNGGQFYFVPAPRTCDAPHAMGRTCGEPTEIKKNTHPENMINITFSSS